MKDGGKSFHQTRAPRTNMFRRPFAETFDEPFPKAFGDPVDELQEQGQYRDIFSAELYKDTIWHVFTQVDNPEFGLLPDDIEIAYELIDEIESQIEIAGGDRNEINASQDGASLTITKAIDPLSPDFHLSYNKVSLLIGGLQIEWYFLLQESPQPAKVAGDKLTSVPAEDQHTDILFERSDDNIISEYNKNSTGFVFWSSSGKNLNHGQIENFIRDQKALGNPLFIHFFPEFSQALFPPSYTIRNKKEDEYAAYDRTLDDPLADNGNLLAERFRGNTQLQHVLDGDFFIGTGSFPGEYISIVQLALQDALKYQSGTQVPQTGVYDKKTREAAIEFQVLFKLTSQDGVIGSETMHKLDSLFYQLEQQKAKNKVNYDPNAPSYGYSVIVNAYHDFLDGTTKEEDYLATLNNNLDSDFAQLEYVAYRRNLLYQVLNFENSENAQAVILKLIRSTPDEQVNYLKVDLFNEQAFLFLKLDDFLEGGIYTEYYQILRIIAMRHTDAAYVADKLLGAEQGFYVTESDDPFFQITWQHGIGEKFFGTQRDYAISYTGNGLMNIQWIQSQREEDNHQNVDPFTLVEYFLADDEPALQSSGHQGRYIAPAFIIQYLNTKKGTKDIEEFFEILPLLTGVGGIAMGLASEAGTIAVVSIIEASFGVAAIAVEENRLYLQENCPDFLDAWTVLNTMVAIYSIGKVLKEVPDIIRSTINSWRSVPEGTKSGLTSADDIERDIADWERALDEEGKPTSDVVPETTLTSAISTYAGFTATESKIIDDVKGLYESDEFLKIRKAHLTNTNQTITYNGFEVMYQHDHLYSEGFGLGADGFLIGPKAFASEDELVKTLLHERYRNYFDPHSTLAVGESTDYTQDAFGFAERAYILIVQ